MVFPTIILRSRELRQWLQPEWSTMSVGVHTHTHNKPYWPT